MLALEKEKGSSLHIKHYQIENSGKIIGILLEMLTQNA